MKRLSLLLVVIICISIMFSGCSQFDSVIQNTQGEIEAEMISEDELNRKIHSICNLATIEVNYHNVAEKTKCAVAWLEKDRKYWIEYMGSAKLGIDASKVNAKIDGENITITLPNVDIIGSASWDNNTAIEYISPDSINSNDITAEEKDDAVNAAQKNMIEEIKNDSSLYVQAEDNAKKIISDFINKMSKINGVEYHIIWENAE